MRHSPLSPQIFVTNRQNFTKQMLPGSVAFFFSNDEQHRSGDQFFPFRQNPDFFYLTGVDQEKSMLMLFPDSPNPALREVLFLLETNEYLITWEGHKLTKEQAVEVSGIKSVLWLPSFEAMMKEAMVYAQHVYLNTIENARYDGDPSYKSLRFARDLIRRYPLHSYKRATPIITKLRMVKSDLELQVLQKAIDLTTGAYLRVLKFVRPGMKEYEIEAEVIHEYICKGATGHSFYPIVASGANACILHYVTNNDICKDGDLLLLDTGAEYANYAGDMTRTFPVNGRFSQRQKEVYNAVLRAMRAAKELMVIGKTIDTLNGEVLQLIEKEVVDLGLLTLADISKQDPANPLSKRYFPHGNSHYMGLDVHDEGHKFEPFRPGMVLSCEPGIYIKEEGIGVRIENNILITENGPVDLTENVPVEVEEIEDIMS